MLCTVHAIRGWTFTEEDYIGDEMSDGFDLITLMKKRFEFANVIDWKGLNSADLSVLY